mgnify:CR=1 FL=1|jgi:hypothetical protein
MRGGKRAGAGRKALNPADKRVQLSISVSPRANEWMRQMAAEQGVPMGVILEVLIDSYEEYCRIEPDL